jgi:hypothetical protein
MRKKLVIVLFIALTAKFSFSQEQNSIVSTSFEGEGDYTLGGYASYTLIDEFAMSVPMLIKLTPINNLSFYLETGIQLDIPFASKIYETDYERPAVETYYYTRAKYDLGAIFYINSPQHDTLYSNTQGKRA